MNFNNKELALLNEMITVAMLSGKIDFNETSESVHKKVTEEILKRNQEQPITNVR